MLTQNKKRIFEKDKIEYTLRSINSILRSVKTSNQLKGIDVNLSEDKSYAKIVAEPLEKGYGLTL